MNIKTSQFYKILKNYKKTIAIAAIIMFGCTYKFNKTDNNEWLIPHIDKIEHFSAFCLLGLVLSYETYKTLIFKQITNKTTKLLTISIAYGLLIEIIQIFLPWRSFDILDIIADSIGAMVGIIIWNQIIKPRIEKL